MTMDQSKPPYLTILQVAELLDKFYWKLFKAIIIVIMIKGTIDLMYNYKDVNMCRCECTCVCVCARSCKCVLICDELSRYVTNPDQIKARLPNPRGKTASKSLHV